MIWNPGSRFRFKFCQPPPSKKHTGHTFMYHYHMRSLSLINIIIPKAKTTKPLWWSLYCFTAVSFVFAMDSKHCTTRQLCCHKLQETCSKLNPQMSRQTHFKSAFSAQTTQGQINLSLMVSHHRWLDNSHRRCQLALVLRRLVYATFTSS